MTSGNQRRHRRKMSKGEGPATKDGTKCKRWPREDNAARHEKADYCDARKKYGQRGQIVKRSAREARFFPLLPVLSKMFLLQNNDSAECTWCSSSWRTKGRHGCGKNLPRFRTISEADLRFYQVDCKMQCRVALQSHACVHRLTRRC